MQERNLSYTKRVERIIDLLSGKWTVEILCSMKSKPIRLSDLRRSLPFASKKALTASLRSLEAAQVIVRRDLSTSVLHVEYELTQRTREPVSALLDHLAEWGGVL
jgi:DNA-binding HxlR family transcriptional regulator